MDIYCLKCKTRTDTKNVEKVTTKNNRNMIKGVCVVCGCKKSKFISNSEVKGSGWTDKLPIEVHMPGYNFLGPGTKLEKRLNLITKEPLPHSKPINKIDEVALRHDLCYEKYKNTKDRNKICDTQMLKELKPIKTRTLGNFLTKRTSKNLIGAKRTLGLGNS